MRERFRKHVEKQSYFKHILLANIVLGISVIFLLAVIFIPAMLSAAEKNDREYEEILLLDASNAFDDLRQDAEDVVSGIEGSEWFHKTFIQNVLGGEKLSAGEKERISKELLITVSKYRLIRNITVRYYDQTDTLYSNNGVFENIGFYQEQEPDNLNFSFFPAEDGTGGFSTVTAGGSEFLVYRRGITDVPGGRNKGEVNVIFRADAVEKRFITGENGTEGFELLDESGNLLWSAGKTGGEGLYTIRSGITKNGYGYGILIPEKMHNSLTRRTVLLSAFSVIVDLILCFVFAFYLSKQNYQPVDLLVKRYVKEDKLQENEIVSLGQAMDSLIEEKELSEHALDQLKPLARYRILRRILNGTVTEEELEPEKLLYCDIILDGDAYHVISIKMKETDAPDAEITETALELVTKEWAAENGIRSYLYSVEKNDYQMLLSCRKGFLFREALEELCGRCEGDGQIAVFGVGNPVEKVREVHHSKDQSMAAVNYAALMNENQIVYYNEIEEKITGDYYYPFSEEVILSRAISDGNADEAEKILGEVISANERLHVQNTDMNRCLFNDLISTVKRTVQSLGISCQRIDEEVFDNYSLKVINERLNLLICECCEKVQNLKEINDVANAAGIIEYIDANITDPSLSLSSVAEAFGRSSSYISTVFKQVKDTGYSDYVNEKRVRMAADLMSSRKMSVEDASRAVGYVSIITFRRNFQKFMKHNPSDYT